MQIKSKTIRNLEVIEKELNTVQYGVLAFPVAEEFEQLAVNFVYHDKNIFVFIQDRELFKNIRFGATAKFTAVRSCDENKKENESAENIYKLFYISVTGIVKKVEEKKLKNIIKQNFIQKYSGRLIEADSRSKSFGKLIIIDSEELLATEEVGI